MRKWLTLSALALMLGVSPLNVQAATFLDAETLEDTEAMREIYNNRNEKYTVPSGEHNVLSLLGVTQSMMEQGSFNLFDYINVNDPLTLYNIGIITPSDLQSLSPSLEEGYTIETMPESEREILILSYWNSLAGEATPSDAQIRKTVDGWNALHGLNMIDPARAVPDYLVNNDAGELVPRSSLDDIQSPADDISVQEYALNRSDYDNHKILRGFIGFGREGSLKYYHQLAVAENRIHHILSDVMSYLSKPETNPMASELPENWADTILYDRDLEAETDTFKTSESFFSSPDLAFSFFNAANRSSRDGIRIYENEDSLTEVPMVGSAYAIKPGSIRFQDLTEFYTLEEAEADLYKYLEPSGDSATDAEGYYDEEGYINYTESVENGVTTYYDVNGVELTLRDRPLVGDVKGDQLIRVSFTYDVFDLENGDVDPETGQNYTYNVAYDVRVNAQGRIVRFNFLDLDQPYYQDPTSDSNAWVDGVPGFELTDDIQSDIDNASNDIVFGQNPTNQTDRELRRVLGDLNGLSNDLKGVVRDLIRQNVFGEETDPSLLSDEVINAFESAGMNVEEIFVPVEEEADGE